MLAFLANGHDFNDRFVNSYIGYFRGQQVFYIDRESNLS